MGTHLMSESHLSVLNRLFERKKAPIRASTPSAMFLPVQVTSSWMSDLSVKGGDQLFRSVSLLLMNSLRPSA